MSRRDVKWRFPPTGIGRKFPEKCFNSCGGGGKNRFHTCYEATFWTIDKRTVDKNNGHSLIVMKIMIILKCHHQNDIETSWDVMRNIRKFQMGLSKIYPCRTWRFFHPNIPLKMRIIFQISSKTGARGGSAQRAADRRFSTTTAREESFVDRVFWSWEFMGELFWRSVPVVVFYLKVMSSCFCLVIVDWISELPKLDMFICFNSSFFLFCEDLR